MSRATDQNYIQGQYQDAANLNARIALHRRFSTAPVDWQTWVFDRFELPTDARVLELGCGTGRLWVQNKDRIRADWEITLSDFSAGMVAQARQNLSSVDHPFAFAQFDAQEIPYPGGSFDAVIANHMLYHLPDRKKTYAEVWRVLKPGNGLFYATANSRDYMCQVAELEDRVGIVGGVKTFMVAADFTLENGEADLAAWFPQVTLRRQKEVLRVTEAQPLIDYILSIVGKPGLSADTQNQIRDIVEAEIKDHGAFRIDKSSGLFICHTEISKKRASSDQQRF